MAKARTSPSDYEPQDRSSITVHPLNKNKRPVGFAAWPESKRKRKKKKRGKSG